MYIVKITCTIQQSGNNIKNTNINLHEIANFRKCAKIYTCENIYVHMNDMIFWVLTCSSWAMVDQSRSRC